MNSGQVTPNTPHPFNSYREITESIRTLIPDAWVASCYLNAEKVWYLRLNQARIRQMTFVEQAFLQISLQKDQKQWNIELGLSGNPQDDIQRIKHDINQATSHWNEIETHPRFFPFTFAPPATYRECSLESFDPEITHKLSHWLTQRARGDLCGLFCYGHSYVFSTNSLGVEREFLNLNGFFDYSLYDQNQLGQPKATKDTYFFQEFNPEALEERWQKKHQEITLLKKASRPLERGLYRAYLTPDAVAELLSTLSWGGLSYDALQKGICPLEAFFRGEREFSSQLSLRENFNLNLGPSFNSLGEIPPRELPLIQEGKKQNLLVSSSSAHKYGIPSNFAEGHGGWGYESPRSLEVLPGTLSDSDILKSLGTGLYLGALHYCNWSHQQSASITGMSRFACFWVENGEIQYPIEDFRFDVSLYELWGPRGLLGLTEKAEIMPRTGTYGARDLGGMKSPGFLVDGFRCVL
ncbi:MAG: metallopeptidase TldD-related protein [Bdellovibrionaceae bacterium]|nr:metallopeptidase TldD-related protein [Pseudobdellovibrionaceae bacterium]